MVEIRDVTIFDWALMTLVNSLQVVIASSFGRTSDRRFLLHAISGIVEDELVELVDDFAIEKQLIDGFSEQIAENYKYKKSYWWVDDDQYIISLGELEGYTVYKKFSYRRIFIPSTYFVYILERKTD